MLNGGYFMKCIEAALGTLKSRIIANDRDQLGVCLFGTEDKDNKMDFENITVLLPLDEPTPQNIQVLEEIVAGHGVSAGHSSADWSRGYPFEQALWVCQQMFSDALIPKDSIRRVFVFTDDPNPVASNQHLTDRAIQKAKDMKQSGYILHLLPFGKSGSFDKLFWKDVLTDPDDQVDIDDLSMVVRKKVFQKRVLCHLRWAIGPGVEIGVGVYNVVSSTRPPQPKYLDDSHNPLVCRTKYFGAVTINELTPDQICRSYEYGGEMVDFAPEDIRQIKDFNTTGLHLLGFKSRNRLKDYHNIKHSYFLYPSERDISGSAKAFFALQRQMLAKRKIAICRLIRNSSSQPCLVALIPTPRVVNEEAEAILSHAGMYMITIPWADEIRDVPAPPPCSDVTEAQQAAADDLVDALTMKSFSSELFPNPVLQKYYACLQAMALGQPAIDEVKDEIVPNASALHFAQDELKTFRKSFFGANYDSTLASLKSSSSSSRTPRVPKPEIGEDGQFDWATLQANNQLGLLTIPDLKIYLKQHSLTLGGKKDDLVDRVDAHIRRMAGKD
eukprot:c17189_g1_i1.p1 GENE.c17189_g1_i1~~c17189_g1_i1.p1  ORF type:complete len:556 (+),score=138.49 c17189_g1_i1:207-1874(+)